MFVDIAHFWWAVPFAVAGLPAVFALYYGLAAAISHRLGKGGISGALIFALLWFMADYARGHLCTGFPWNLEGYAWGAVLPMLQITSVVGIYGLTLITLLACCLPAILEDDTRRNRTFVIFSLLILTFIDGWGQMRLTYDDGAKVEGVRLRLVQPGIEQAKKWLPSQREANFARLIGYFSAPAAEPVTDIVWPETAATFYLMEDSEHRHEIASHLPKGGTLLTGVIRRLPDADGRLSYFNSLVAVDDKSDVIAGYDKHHLVPYGEYIPFRRLLPLPAIASLGLDFSFGDGPETLRVPGLPPFSPLICYEVIFPDETVDPRDRPKFILNVTNDGWYGRTAGPYQHFASARVRAIEQGLPLVRDANTGITGVVDAYGRVTARLGLKKSGFVDADLPQDLPPTFFSRHGETALWIIMSAFAISAIAMRLKPNRRPRKNEAGTISFRKREFL